MPFDMSNRTTRSSQKRQSQGLVYIVGDHHNKDIHKTRICKETNEQKKTRMIERPMLQGANKFSGERKWYIYTHALE